MKMSDTDHHLPATHCPWCDWLLDTATGLKGDDAPEVGAITVCINCGSVSQFGVGFVLERCPEAVWQSQPKPIPDQIRAARRAVILIHSKGNRQ